jgi:uncharacterized membrane protein HdeD (DUF308 family)
MPTRAQVQILDPKRWWLLVLVGLFGVVVGILALSYTGITLIAIGLFFGLNLMLIGSMGLVLAGEERVHYSEGIRIIRILLAFLALLAGLFCIVHPGFSVLVVLLAVGFWFIAQGVAEIAEAYHEKRGRWLNAVLGVIAIAAGVIVIGDPDIGLRTLAIIAGLGFLVRGLVQIFAGLHLRRFA